MRGTCRDLVPLGQVKSKWNFSLVDKRVLNFDNVVNDSDNIKQDLSIDVYGRAEKAEAEAKAAEAQDASSGNGNGAAENGNGASSNGSGSKVRASPAPGLLVRAASKHTRLARGPQLYT